MTQDQKRRDQCKELIGYREFIEAVHTIQVVHKVLMPKRITIREILKTKFYEREFMIPQRPEVALPKSEHFVPLIKNKDNPFNERPLFDKKER